MSPAETLGKWDPTIALLFAQERARATLAVAWIAARFELFAREEGMLEEGCLLFLRTPLDKAQAGA